MTVLAPIAAVALAPDLSWAVTVAEDGTVLAFIKAANHTFPFRRIDAGKPFAVALSGSPIRSPPLQILWATEETLRLYEYGKGYLPRADPFLMPAPIQALALSASGHIAAAALDNGALQILDVSTWKLGRTLATDTRAARAVAIAPDEGSDIAVSADGSTHYYDLKKTTSAIVGIAAQACAAAITPNGDIIIAASTDGSIRRWNRRLMTPPDKFELDVTVTAIAVNGTGDKVLVGTADGEALLYDLSDGSRIQYRVTETPQRLYSGLPHSLYSGRGENELPASRVIVDEDVRFTVYRPQVLSPGVWASLLVFAHKTNLIEESGKAPIDPNDLVEARARVHFGDTTPRPVSGDARHGIIRGARLRIIPDLPRIQCNPIEAEIDWWEPVHEAMFRLRAGPDLARTVVRGAVRIWYGPLILGEVSLAISIGASGAITESQPVTDSAPRYRKIFPSYSHKDQAIVAAFAEAARALGDQYLQDVLTLRSGERWEGRLLELIENADVFQLFWSRNSMYSSYCRDEWEHALSLCRPSFIRPLYWEEPLPQDVGHDLPPATLRALHFVRVLVDKPGLDSPAVYGVSAGESTAPAAFAWEMPAPKASAPSSPARTFYRSGASSPAGAARGASKGRTLVLVLAQVLALALGVALILTLIVVAILIGVHVI